MAGEADAVSQTAVLSSGGVLGVKTQSCFPDTKSSPCSGRHLERKCARAIFPVPGEESPAQEEQGGLTAKASQPSMQPPGGGAEFEAVESFSCGKFGQSPKARKICSVFQRRHEARVEMLDFSKDMFTPQKGLIHQLGGDFLEVKDF